MRFEDNDCLEEALHTLGELAALKTDRANPDTTLYTGLRGRNTPSKGASDNESDDSYRGVLFQIAPRWRAIVCKDGIQFILQYRTSPTEPRRWRAKSYPTSRDGLRESISRLVGSEACSAVEAQINSLPEHVLDLA